MAIENKILTFGTGKVGTVGVNKVMGYNKYQQAIDFINSANITNATQIEAINYLVKQLIDNNLMSKFSFIYPFVGGTATKHSYNLVNPNLFQLTFSGGWTHSSNGILPNATNTWANTNCIANSISTINDVHISYYSRTDSAIGYELTIGVFDGTRGLALRIREGINNRGYAFFRIDSTNQPFFNSNIPSKGLHIANTTSSTSRQLVKNGTILNENTVSDTYLAPNIPIYIGASNLNGSPALYTDKECAFASGGLGLTNSEITTFNTIVQTYQTILGRNV